MAAAACFLPLTVNPEAEQGTRVASSRGDRPRPKKTTQCAIVVSEETGSVSIVVDGQIERGLDSDQLRARLRALRAAAA